MSYALLRNSCSTQSSALTSNEKFLPIDDPSYLKCCLDFYRYPAEKHTFTDGDMYEDPNHPERLVSYFGKNTMPGSGYPHANVHSIVDGSHGHHGIHHRPMKVSGMKCCGK